MAAWAQRACSKRSTTDLTASTPLTKITGSFHELGEPYRVGVKQEPLRKGRLLHVNHALLQHLQVTEQDTELCSIANGDHQPSWVTPIATVYSGHQFGVWAGQLGDGRATCLSSPVSETGTWDLCAKGSGRTPYSRWADGKAVLRSTVREYVAQEAMHALGVPTWRSGLLLTSSEFAQREAGPERCALLWRAGRSMLRVGHIEHHAREDSQRLPVLLAHLCHRLWNEHVDPGEVPVDDVLIDVVERNARMCARWQVLGFTHGVLNTDNISLTGETIDYGPFGMMATFVNGYVPNTSDTEGRYAFGRQPSIIRDNCGVLLSHILAAYPKCNAQEAIDRFQSTYVAEYMRGMGARVGLHNAGAEHWPLVRDLLKLLESQKMDYDDAMRSLAPQQRDSVLPTQQLDALDSQDARQWLIEWRATLAQQGLSEEEAGETITRSVPRCTPRTAVLDLLIDAAEREDVPAFHALFQQMIHPFDRPSADVQRAMRASHAPLSCSS